MRGQASEFAGRRLSIAIAGLNIDLAVAGVVLMMLLLGFIRLDRYPAPWFDEGIHLQVAKNLVADGTYAARSADGTLDYAPSIGVGPTLLLPVAGTLKLFGTSLEAGRAVPVLYLMLATALIFMISRRLFGRLAAFTTLIILLAMPALDWVETGRQVLGEVPALTFVLLGGLLVLRARSIMTLIPAGLVLGLALVTKGQYVLILPAALLALAAIDLRWTRHRTRNWHVTLFVAVMSAWALWIATLLLVVGDGNVVENVGMLRESSSGALLVFDIGRMAAAWRVVLGPSTFMLVVPASIFGIWTIRVAEGERRFALLALWLVQAAWLGWFVTASIGWPRYAFAGLALNAIFAGDLIKRLAGLARQAFFRPTRFSPAIVVAGLALVALVAAGNWRTLSPIVRQNDQDAVRFAALVDNQVPAGSVVDGWEPELGFLSDHPYQAPPPGSLSTVVEARWFGGTMPDFSSDLDGDFLVIGPFARWVGVYREASASTNWQQMAVVGQYTLYQRLD
jgi:4-amino-4-deoxy-L-arabinose transferase-like glycosyltransferase